MENLIMAVSKKLVTHTRKGNIKIYEGLAEFT